MTHPPSSLDMLDGTPGHSAAASDDGAVARLRVPPHSVEAEQAVLGGLLLDNAAWFKIGDLLTQSDFYRFEHQHIYEMICELVREGKPADVLTVFEGLLARGRAQDCGGLAHLNALAQSVPSASNIRRYAELVRERAILRKLIGVSDEVADLAFNPQGRAVTQLLAEAESKVLAIGQEGHRSAVGNIKTMAVLVHDLIGHVEEMAAAGGDDVTGVRTGFYDLDKMTSGMQKGDLLILAARPSMGKTALALNIAENVAVQEGAPVLIFSMEMGASQLALRMVGSLGRIDQSALRTGRLSQDDWGRFSEAGDKLAQASVHIDETPALTVDEVSARARRVRHQVGPLALVVIDYIQLMSASGGGRDENRATELSEISRGLKALAKDLQCPVLALSQLNRGVESRNDKRPLMSDLRESGAIEQDADLIFFIYRDEYYNKEASKAPGQAEVIIAKQRNGPTGTVHLAFQGKHTRFDNLAPGSYGD